MSLEGSHDNGWKHTICNGNSKFINLGYHTLEKCFILYSIWRCVQPTSWASMFLWCQASLCNRFEWLNDLVKFVSFFRVFFLMFFFSSEKNKLQYGSIIFSWSQVNVTSLLLGSLLLNHFLDNMLLRFVGIE